jgi:heterogeneous nuclear rnp K-like protein 2
MSASPTTTTSAKRPHEEPSSPSGPSDQPNAKRLALDNAKADADEVTESIEASNGVPAEESNGVESTTKEGQDETAVAEVPDREGTQPIETATSARGTQEAPSSNLPRDESGWIHIRSVISSAEAATVIGKGGENVAVIRKMSNAKCTVSDYQKGAVERILTVSGTVEHVAKVSFSDRITSMVSH